MRKKTRRPPLLCRSNLPRNPRAGTTRVCGSGGKYKKCHLGADEEAPPGRLVTPECRRRDVRTAVSRPDARCPAMGRSVTQACPAGGAALLWGRPDTVRMPARTTTDPANGMSVLPMDGLAETGASAICESRPTASACVSGRCSSLGGTLCYSLYEVQQVEPGRGLDRRICAAPIGCSFTTSALQETSSSGIARCAVSNARRQMVPGRERYPGAAKHPRRIPPRRSSARPGRPASPNRLGSAKQPPIAPNGA